MVAMMEFMGLFMLLGLLVLGVLVAGGVYLAFRYGAREVPPSEDAQGTLDRRLAAGEIDADEYHERASALQSRRPSKRRR